MSPTQSIDDVRPLGTEEPVRRRLHPSTRMTVAILVAISVGVTLVFWPGHMDGDAIGQITQARSGHFVDWWAPVLDAMWRVLFLLHLSPGFVLLTSTTIFVLSVFELLRTVLSRGIAIGVTLLIVAFPPVLGFLGALQRETWFGASALAAYALLVRVHRGATRRPRLMAGLAFLAIWIAMAARQDAVIALLPAIAIAVWILLPVRHRAGVHAASRWSGKPARALRAVIGVVVVVTVFMGSQWVIKYPVLGAKRTYPQQAIYFMDLANLSLREQQVLIPSFAFPSQDLAVLAAHNPRYTFLPLAEGQNIPLRRNPEAVFPSWVNKSEYSKLQHAWLSAILKHPKGYIRERSVAWLRQIGWSGPTYVPYNPGFAGNPWGYKALVGSLNNAGTSYLSFFTEAPLEGGPIYRVWPYMIVGVLAGIDLLRRRRSAPIRIIGAMFGFAFIDYLAYFFIAPGQDFRYAWYMIGTVAIAVVVDLVDLVKVGVVVSL